MKNKNQRLEDSAEYHRRSVMSKDERAIIARDEVAKNIHQQNIRDGKNTTYDEAVRKATQIANKVHRERQEHD